MMEKQGIVPEEQQVKQASKPAIKQGCDSGRCPPRPDKPNNAADRVADAVVDKIKNG
jgi:hypothetical protein